MLYAVLCMHVQLSSLCQSIELALLVLTQKWKTYTLGNCNYEVLSLPQDALHNVAKATLLSRLLYASPSWWGMTSADERLKIERFINKSRRLGYLPANQPTMETMTDEADRRLLRAV